MINLDNKERSKGLAIMSHFHIIDIIAVCFFPMSYSETINWQCLHSKYMASNACLIKLTH